MATPALGNVQHLQVRRGIKVSFFFLVLVLAVIQVLTPDGVYAFRIRDVGTASSEQTRPSCNPLFAKCTDQKTSGISSTLRIRKKFESSSTVSPRKTRIQPLVEESGEEDDGQASLASGTSSVKSKLDKSAGPRVADKAKVQFRTSSVAKTGVRNTGLRGSIGLKKVLVSSDEDGKGGETEENSEDEEDLLAEEDPADEEDEEVVDDDDDEDDEEKSEVDGENSSHDIAVDGAAVDDSGAEDDREETTESDDNEDDDDNDDESDDNEQEQSEDEQYKDIKSADIVEDTPSKIKYQVEIVKHDGTSDKKNINVISSRDEKSVEIEPKKSIEKLEDEVENVKFENSEENDETDSEEITIVNKDVGSKIGSESPALHYSKISESDDVVEKNAEGSESEYKVTLPPRKLEKVRLADKAKSMETLRSRSIEILSEKVEPKKVEKSASEVKKVVTPKPTQPIVQKPEVKPPKTGEKISPSATIREVKKPEIQEKIKAAPQPKKETKSSKQSEKQRVKTPKPKAEQTAGKSNKGKSKTRTEASVTLPELNDLLLHVPSFTPNFTAIKDPVCQQHGKIFLRQLRGYKLWALQMLDSSAKIPSGILRGNLNQLGDFDQCVGVKAHVKVDEKTVKVQGKYCLATIDLQATRNDMKIPVNLMQSRASLRSSTNEPTHFVPRFTTLNWALCVPAVCSPEDVRSVMEDALKAYNVSMGLKFTVGIESDSCYVKQKTQSYSKETVAVLYFYAMTLCLVFVATLRDFCVSFERQGSYSERMIMAFSLRRTTAALMRNSKRGEDIGCVHGVRTLATIFLYVIHKLMLASRIPFANRISFTEAANNPASSILRVSIVYADSFLLISGVLTAYNMAKEFNERGEIRWFCRFVTRFIRLTPALLAVVFWYAFVMEHVGSGPQWSSVVNSNAELCKKNAWTNLLYIQNFFPFEEMCATHTHQMALEIQLSLIAPMLVFFLYCKPIVGILVVLFLLQVSATVRYFATSNNYLSVVIFHGMTLKHLYRTANLTLASPLHRATPYLFGVVLGALMRYTGSELRIHKVLVITGWLMAAVLGSWSLLSPWRLARRDYTYDVEEATYYAVILPICWAASLSWIIFASFTNHGGVVNKFLSSHWMVVLSRLSYSVYLTQFAVFFYNLGTTRYSSEFQVHRSIDLYELATIYAISITLTLLLDLPMQEVKNVIMECTDGMTIDEIGREEKNADLVDADKYQKTTEESEERKVLVEGDAPESSHWNWRKEVIASRKIETGYLDDTENSEIWEYRKGESRKKSFIVQDADDEEIPTWDWIKTPGRKLPRRNNEEDEDLRTERRSQSRQGMSESEYTDDSRSLKRSSFHQVRDEDRRSQSRASEGRRIPELKIRDDSSSSKRSSVKDYDIASRDSTRRERSLGKASDNTAASTWRSEEQTPWEYVKRERSASQSAKDGRKGFIEGLEVQSPALRLSTRSLPRASELRQRKSSESEEEPKRVEKPNVAKIVPPSEEPRVSDEESWEQELRLRRQKISQNLPSYETGTASEEEEWNILKRRSSAEGRMALLNDPPAIEHFGGWSISKIPNPTPGSFPREHSESEEENAYVATRTDFRETQPPFRENYDTQSEEETSWDPSRQQSYTSGSQPTSIDEEEGSSPYDFVLKKGSKRTSLQNLSKISQEEPEFEDDSGWDFVKEENTDSSSAQTTSTTGLFKRASIVKSQASEEDPEYILPERPKLVEQEQEHPFKKAWQMQKSRSEEDGPVGFLVKEKDGKPRSAGTEGRKDTPQQDEGKRKPSTGGQAEDLSYFGGDEAESTSVSYPASNSGDSANLDWVEEDERSGTSAGLDEAELDSIESVEKDATQSAPRKKEQKRHSEESNWEWNQEET